MSFPYPVVPYTKVFSPVDSPPWFEPPFPHAASGTTAVAIKPAVSNFDLSFIKHSSKINKTINKSINKSKYAHIESHIALRI